MSTLPSHRQKQQRGEQKKYRWDYYLLTHGWDEKDSFPGGVLPGWPLLPEDKGGEIGLILYSLSCFSGSKLTFYLITENMNPSMRWS